MPQPDEEETREAVKIAVPGKDEIVEDKEKKHNENIEDPEAADSDDKKKKEGDDDEMSAEDQALKEGLELAVERISDNDIPVQLAALEHLRTEIRTATSSMTSVPKPLKFLRPHYQALKDIHKDVMKDIENKKLLSDILAVLAMTMAEEGSRECLSYKLAGNITDLGSWGHEFIRSLAGEIGIEYNERYSKIDEEEIETEPDVSDLMILVDLVVPFHITHNAFAEAVDLLVEVSKLPKLLELDAVDSENFERICLYLIRCGDFMSDPEDIAEIRLTAYKVYFAQKSYPNALRVAMMLLDMEKVTEVYEACEDETVKHQLGFMMGRQHLNFETEDEKSNELIGNSQTNEYYLALARDLDVMDAKTPEDIYKSHLAETGGFRRNKESQSNVKSARENLASTFVNALVNAGYGQDSLVTREGNNWIYQHKDHGKMSTAASIGMVLLWNVEEGINQIDKFLLTQDDHIRAGAILAIGIVSSGTRNDSDPAFALLSEYLESTNANMKNAACFGIGLAYAGSAREDIAECLTPIVANTESPSGTDLMTEVALAGLSLGFIQAGTCDEEAGTTIVQRLMESSDAELDHPMTKFLVLGLGLLYLQKMEQSDAMVEILKTIEHKIGKFAVVCLEACAYAGTGNVLKIQHFLQECAQHLQEDADHQSMSVIGIALACVGEDIGAEMAIRSFDHLLHYGELPIKRAVPLGLALLNISNPDYSVVDQLSRLSHDGDAAVAQNAILALGLCSGGTNNSRVAGLLRQLAEFYAREAGHLFIVRIAQGFLHMGKGLITINPFHSDRLLMSPTATCGILTILVSALDMKNTILDKHHYLLYSIVTAMNPRMLITVDEDLKPLPVSVRVGQAVETVGQAGRPKTITGFQTHTTPVLLSVKDRAELADEDYEQLSPVLEGVVILKKKPVDEESA